MSRLALYPGSFDPFTNGHLDVLKRALRVFDAVELTVAVNPGKQSLFTTEERCELIRAATQNLSGVTVAVFEGLLVEYARSRGAIALVRGLRQVGDFDFEFRMAFANRRLHPDLETVLFLTGEENAFISSSIVREIHAFGGDTSSFVPPAIEKALQQKRAGGTYSA